MRGRAEVWRLKQSLDVTFGRVKQLDSNTELQSDFARYLVVLVSGYVEQAVRELLQDHARGQSSPSIQKYVERGLSRTTNLKAGRLIDLLGRFDTDWAKEIELFVVDERKDALDSVVDLRNQISHGISVGVTYTRIAGYYNHIQEIIDHVADICAPVE